MPTVRQLAIAQKKQDTERKLPIIARVCSAAMHLLHDSHMADTTLWPRKGFLAGFRQEDDKSDSIRFSARMEFDQGKATWQAIYFNVLNKSGARCYKQAKQIDLILDQAVYDGVHFLSQQEADNYFYHNECFFTGLEFTSIYFKFTIT